MENSNFKLTPEGARIGIDEHEKKIKTLEQEKNTILKKEVPSKENEKRLDDIQTEINYRNQSINKLKPYQ